MNLKRIFSIIAVAFVSGGIAGGIVSALRTPTQAPPSPFTGSTTSTAPIPAIPTSTEPLISLVSVERRPVSPLLPPAFVKRRSPGIGTIYRKPRGTALEERMLGEDRALGRAVSLTSDGWFVTSAGVVEGLRLSDLVVWDNGTSYSIESGLVDHVTGAVFFHVRATGLSAPAFAQAREASVGAEVWIESKLSGLFPTSVVNEGGRLAPNDAVSSEVASRRLILNGKTSALDRGGAVWDPNGSLIGVIESKTGEDLRVIPGSAIAGSFASLLSKGDVRHASLGIRAIDLGTARFDGLRDGLPMQGALVRVAKAPLKIGDVILRVERDTLDGTIDLGEVLADYQPGATVTLRVLRGTSDSDMSVTLGSIVTSEAVR